MPSSETETLAGDLLRGCEAIAAYIDRAPRETFYLLQGGVLPAFKQGRIWISTKSRLRRYYNESTFVPAPKKEPSKRKLIRKRKAA
jgi:hypothetical protein